MINVKFHGILKKTLGRRSYKSFDELKFFVKNNIYPSKIVKQKNGYIVVPLISGEGGGKGKGQSAPVPLLKPPAPDENALQSFSQSEVVDLICEGPIEGFCEADGSIAQGANIAKGVYFNGTAVQNDQGSYNYRKLALNYVLGDHQGINPATNTWARSKIYNTQSIKQKLVGPNMKSTSDGGAILTNGNEPDFASMGALMRQEGKTSVASDFNKAGWFSVNGAHIGYFLGTSASVANAQKFGYAASDVQHGSDIRYHTTRRDFTSWSAGHAEFSEAGFPVSHTITNPEVDFAYVTISVDDLKDTVDHGAGAGKVGQMTTSREHKVGFQVEIGVNGVTDEEAKSDEYQAWLSYHGVTQDGSSPRKSITRNYFVQGLVAGSSYLIDVGRASFGDDGEVIFGVDGDNDSGMNSIEDSTNHNQPSEGGTNPAEVFDAEELKGVTSDQAIPHTFAPSADEPALGLNRFRQFGEDDNLRSQYESALRTSFIPIKDANNAYNCFKMPPAVAGKTRYIKVTKTGREMISPIMSSKITFESVTEIIDEKMAYPYSAVIQQSFNSRYFSDKPERTYHLKLKKILIPSNYTPADSLGQDNRVIPGTSIYNGAWDGTFKYAWSDNPAWVLYDLMINNRYGIGAYLDIDKIDKWTLYKIGRYCDAVDDQGKFVGVDDTRNGKEPRYTMNVMISEEEEAYELLKTIAETFHGIAYWDGRGVSISLDGGNNAVAFTSYMPGTSYAIGKIVEFPASTFNFFKKIKTGGSKTPGVDNNWEEFWQKVPGIQIDDPSINFSNSNVEGGTFAYFTSSKTTRYTVARVGYMDKTDNFRKKYEYVEDKQGVKELGVIKKNIEPLGCTSRGQARRMGRWFFLTSSINTETITFSTDYRALFLKPGNIVSVTDKLKNTNQSIGKVIAIEGTDTLKLTHPVSLKAYDIESRQQKYFDIIVGNIDPQFDSDFLDALATGGSSRSITTEDLSSLNKSQRIKGSVYPADGSSPVTDKIKIKNENGAFLKFTDSLEVMYADSTYNTIPKGSDWALIHPTDGGDYGDAWKDRKYRIQAIEEEGQGKYKVIAMHFDEEKLSSMDQTFPVITPGLDIALGSASGSANVTSPVIEKMDATSSSTLTFSVKFYTTVDESKFTNITNNIVLVSPSGDQTTHNAASRDGGGTKSFNITTALAKNSTAATGTWSILVTTFAVETASGKSKSSPAGILSEVISNQTYRSGPPGIATLAYFENGNSAGNDYYVTSNNPSIDVRWEYTDIDGGSTVYDDTSTLTSTSPFFEGFKIGLCAYANSGSGDREQLNNIIWIYDEDNLYKRLNYSFTYDLRFNQITDSNNNPAFEFSNIKDMRNIALIVQPVAKAGTEIRKGNMNGIRIYDSQTTFSASVDSRIVKFVPKEQVYYDLNNDRKIRYIETDEDGVETQKETAALGEIPEENVRFDYAKEFELANIDEIFTMDDALSFWNILKDNTINGKNPAGSSWTFDEIKNNAEKYEDYGVAQFNGSENASTKIHWINFSIVNFWKQEGLTDQAILQELGSFEPETVIFNDENKDKLRKNIPDDAGANTLAGFDSLNVNISGDYDNGGLSTKDGVGYAALYVNRNSPDFNYDPEKLAKDGENASKFIITYDEEAEGGINYDRDYYFKLKIFDSFDWKNSLLGEDEKIEALPCTELDFGVTGFMVIPQEDLEELTTIDEDDSTIDELGHAFINTFGDERVVGMKQFREGLIIGGTNDWEIADGRSSNANSFVKYPLATQKSFEGSPVGIGQYNLNNLQSHDFVDLQGQGDSASTFDLTSGTLDSELEDFHVNVKGMNIKCVPGDRGDYDGQGGTISGGTIKTAVFEAGDTSIQFLSEPLIEGTPLTTYVQGEGLNTAIESQIQGSTHFGNIIQDQDFTKNLIISGNSKLRVENGKLNFQVNGIWYKIEHDGIA